MKEWDIGLARDSARQKRLAGTGRAHEQNTARYFGSDIKKFFGVFKKINHFFKLLFGFFKSGDITENNLVLKRGKQLNVRLAEGEGLVHATVGLPENNQDKDTYYNRC